MASNNPGFKIVAAQSIILNPPSSGNNPGYKKNKSNQHQNQRGSKSFTNLSASDQVRPKPNKNRYKKNSNQNDPFRDEQPSYNEFVAPQININGQPMPAGISIPSLSLGPNPGYQSSSVPPYQLQNQYQRGSKSLTNLSAPDQVMPKPNKNRNKKKSNQNNTFRDAPPSYNESVAPHININGQPMPAGFSIPSLSLGPNPGKPFSSVPQYQFLNQYPLPQQQQFPHHQQFPQIQPFQATYYNQPYMQQSPNNIQLQNYNYKMKSRPNNISKQPKVTSGVNQSVPSEKKSNKLNTGIDLNCLVRELSEFNGFFTSVENLSKIISRNYNDVFEAVKSNRRIFATLIDDSKKALVELCPEIELCHEHIGSFGCTKQKCLSLHICENFVNDKCQIKNCPFGHIWKTNHNNLVYKEFCLSTLPNISLHNLVKKVLGKKIIPKICSDYLQNKCKLDDECDNLHICNSYVITLGNCETGTNCLFNHNIRNSNCLAIFQSIGISTNESPRDLLKILKNKYEEEKVSERQSLGNAVSFKFLPGCTTTTVKPKTKAVNKEKNKKSQSLRNDTICCWQFYGNVNIPEICIENIDKKCNHFSKGCKYLHCNHKSHWQFGNNETWYNFHAFHSQILDKKYMDANCDHVILPKLNPTKVNNQQASIFSLMGKDTSKVNFTNMVMNCEGTKKIYSIRQLTTKSNAACSDIESTIFKWYFFGNDGKWILFGNEDSSFDTIEKVYQDIPSGKFNLEVNAFTYLLDFSNMTQENISTQKIRPIKRRPFLKEDIIKEKEEKFKIPKLWEKMNDTEIYKLVVLSSGNEEYFEVRHIMRLSLPMIDIVNIFRIQNENLWKQFQNKQKELKKKHNDDLNIQKLFHGIDPQYLQEICRDNLEFRLHDDATEEKPYGDGTYFYNSAAVAAKDCKIDFMGNKTILVADVIIGSVAVGSKGMARPPSNPLFNDDLCNTTIDNTESPTVFVKYNRQEYYPAYIVELK